MTFPNRAAGGDGVGPEKLVRDGIPARVARGDRDLDFRACPPEERLRWLSAKLEEETREVCDDPCPEELGDVIEVVRAIADQQGIPWVDVESARLAKKAERGGFDGGVIMRLGD